MILKNHTRIYTLYTLPTLPTLYTRLYTLSITS